MKNSMPESKEEEVEAEEGEEGTLDSLACFEVEGLLPS